MSVRILTCLVFCGLLGCAGNTPAPIEDRGGAQPRPESSSHIVKRGDTLYSISFRYGMDFRKVAAANGIAPPYTIYPGQQIRLTEAPQVSAVVPASTYPVAAPPAVHSRPAPLPGPAPPSVTTPRGIPLPAPEPSRALEPTPAPESARLLEPSPAPEPSPPSPSTNTEQPATVGLAAAPVTPAVPAATAALERGREQEQEQAAPRAQSGAETFTGEKVAAWRWPTSGPVIRGYSESVHKGIDIGGARGDPVTAVAAGKVVYAGTGIAGFGELLIIKHNDVYLSAYGHNDELLVAEGDTVAAGQAIAQKGSSGTDAVKLHFEIRQEGKPIDPQRLLPRR